MDYQMEALRTEAPPTQALITRLSDPRMVRMLHAAMGLVTESAELLDMLKKHIFYGKPFDTVNALEELGDSCWYQALAIDVLQTTLEEIQKMNIEKLRERFPEKFTESHAIDRDTAKEREILENGAAPALVCDWPVIGAYYTLMDGQVAYVTGCNSDYLSVSYRLDDEYGLRRIPVYDTKDWVRRPDLRDFPNAQDPRLPYDFDLYWDLKYESEVRRALERGHDDAGDIIHALHSHGLAHVIPEHTTDSL